MLVALVKPDILKCNLSTYGIVWQLYHDHTFYGSEPRCLQFIGIVRVTSALASHDLCEENATFEVPGAKDHVHDEDMIWW